MTWHLCQFRCAYCTRPFILRHWKVGYEIKRWNRPQARLVWCVSSVLASPPVWWYLYKPLIRIYNSYWWFLVGWNTYSNCHWSRYMSAWASFWASQNNTFVKVILFLVAFWFLTIAESTGPILCSLETIPWLILSVYVVMAKEWPLESHRLQTIKWTCQSAGTITAGTMNWFQWFILIQFSVLVLEIC